MKVAGSGSKSSNIITHHAAVMCAARVITVGPKPTLKPLKSSIMCPAQLWVWSQVGNAAPVSKWEKPDACSADLG